MDIPQRIQHCNDLKNELIAEFAKLREIADEWGAMRNSFFWSTPDHVDDRFTCRRPLKAHDEDRLIDVKQENGIITFVFEQANDPTYFPSELFVPESFLTADTNTKVALARQSVLDQVAEWAPGYVASVA